MPHKKKRRRLFRDGFHNIHYLHDNATPHSAAVTCDKLREIGFNVLPHPSYSPDLAPSDFYLFSALKSVVRGNNFSSAAEITFVVNNWTVSKSKDFFSDGIKILPDRWQKCVNHNGEYFEHLRNHDYIYKCFIVNKL